MKSKNILISSPRSIECWTLLVCIVTEFLYLTLKDGIVQYTFPISKMADQRYRDTILTDLGKLFSLFAEEKVILLILVLIRMFSPLVSILALLNLDLAHLCIGLIKIFIGDKRPISHYNQGHRMSFGNPSGHNMTSIVFYLTLFHYLSPSFERKNRFYITGIIGVLMIFARLILFKHTLDQAIHGLNLGILVHTFFMISQFHSSFKMTLEVIISCTRKKVIWGVVCATLVLMFCISGLFLWCVFLVDDHTIIEDNYALQEIQSVLFYNFVGPLAMIGYLVGRALATSTKYKFNPLLEFLGIFLVGSVLSEIQHPYGSFLFYYGLFFYDGLLRA